MAWNVAGTNAVATPVREEAQRRDSAVDVTFIVNGYFCYWKVVGSTFFEPGLFVRCNILFYYIW